MTRILPLLLLAACVWSTPGDGPANQGAEADAAGLVQVDRQGLRAHMTAPADHVRVYNLWATWCAPCIAEMPELMAFDDAHPEIDLWFVNTDHPKMADKKLPRFIERHGLQGRRHLRPSPGESDVTAAIPEVPSVLPTTYVVGKSGTVTHTFRGRVGRDQLERVVR